MGQYTDIDDVLKKTVKLIFDLRIARKCSQEDIAGELGINQNTYSKWETGQTELTLRKLMLLCKFHQVEPAVFFGNVFGELRAECIQVVEQRVLHAGDMRSLLAGVREIPTAADLLFAVVEIGRALRGMADREGFAGEPNLE